MRRDALFVQIERQPPVDSPTPADYDAYVVPWDVCKRCVGQDLYDTLTRNARTNMSPLVVKYYADDFRSSYGAALLAWIENAECVDPQSCGEFAAVLCLMCDH